MVEVGQLYVDKMFHCEMEISDADEQSVWVKHTEDGREGKGSIYPREMFEGNVEVGRFQRVDHLIQDAGSSKVSPQEFAPQDALSW